MARVYATAHPPRCKLLARYGDDFPDFIERFPPASELRYLPDVARLEAARTRAHHAADAEPLAADRVAALHDASLPSLRLVLHPSAEVVRSRHPIVTVWAMNAGEMPLGPIAEDAAEDALVVRPCFTVQVRALPPGGAAFVLAIARGATLCEAAEAAAADDGRFDLSSNLAGLLGGGALAGIAPDNTKRVLSHDDNRGGFPAVRAGRRHPPRARLDGLHSIFRCGADRAGCRWPGCSGGRVRPRSKAGT